jgi:hypothetical protein
MPPIISLIVEILSAHVATIGGVDWTLARLLGVYLVFKIGVTFFHNLIQDHLDMDHYAQSRGFDNIDQMKSWIHYTQDDGWHYKPPRD